MKAELHPGARKDFDEAFDWYSLRDAEAARRFEAAVSAALSAIETHPQRFASYDDQHRYLKLTRFPYLLIYRTSADSLSVMAIAHTSRQPGYWNKRV